MFSPIVQQCEKRWYSLVFSKQTWSDAWFTTTWAKTQQLIKVHEWNEIQCTITVSGDNINLRPTHDWLSRSLLCSILIRLHWISMWFGSMWFDLNSDFITVSFSFSFMDSLIHYRFHIIIKSEFTVVLMLAASAQSNGFIHSEMSQNKSHVVNAIARKAFMAASSNNMNMCGVV